MIVECPWCGTQTRPVKRANGDYACGRCKRTLLNDSQHNRRIRTMQTVEYKDKIRNKIFDRTRDWPTLEKGARRNPEPIWARLLNGKKYNITYRDAVPTDSL